MQEPRFWEVTDSFVLLALASLVASRTLLRWFLANLDYTLDGNFGNSVGTKKKRFLWAMAAAQAAKNHGDEWDLTCYIWGIYT